MEQAVIHSPLGPLTLFAEDDHLTALVYGDYGSYDDLPLFREAKRQLEAYFAGQRQAFSLPSTRMERHSSAGFGRVCAISHTEG